MQKNTRQNLLLLLIVAILAASIFLFKQDRKTDQALRLPINTNDISTITIQHGNTIRLTKHEQQWQMLWPSQGLVKPERIEKMLTHLMLPLAGGFPVEQADLSLYGLEQPRMQVILNNETLSFGMLNTMQQMHYIQFKNTVYLARPFLQISFDKSVNELLIATETDTKP